MKFSMITCLLFVSFLMNGQAPSVALDVLQEIKGEWNGSLTYTDYKDDVSTFTLKCEMNATWDGSKGDFAISFTEPNGRVVNDKVKLKWLKKGKQLRFEGETYEVDSFDKDETTGHWDLVMSCMSSDNYKAARIRQHIEFDHTSVLMTREVRYAGRSEFFIRNQYTFEKK